MFVSSTTYSQYHLRENPSTIAVSEQNGVKSFTICCYFTHTQKVIFTVIATDYVRLSSITTKQFSVSLFVHTSYTHILALYFRILYCADRINDFLSSTKIKRLKRYASKIHINPSNATKSNITATNQSIISNCDQTPIAQTVNSKPTSLITSTSTTINR
ncbi:hypothetical protein Tcan_00242 [Toxocara canis]|uniref:Uncharacterized protein n=1 Tax=Toxocara canis TaxID=6265 RepID=A0A0B2VL53_TOXCA|nr:hypothetical protein Tcan_00242 [Toxocara canis]